MREEQHDQGGDESSRATAQGIDSSYLTTLYVEYGPELKRFIRGVVRDPEVANDVLQATFARAIELGHTARRETLRGWLFRVALNQAILTRRKQGVHDQASRKLAQHAKRDAERPEESLIRGETVEAVRRSLLELSDAEREVVMARVYENKTFAHIAAEQGLPVGTVLTRMRRALQKLKRGLASGEESR